MGYKGLEIIENELAKLEDFIIKNIDSPQSLISSTVKQLSTAGGKRIRPALTILMGKAFGNKFDKILPVAASMEIIHMATLVHDDIIDDAEFRRGKPTVQSKYGKDIAVFTGDYLFSKAFHIIARYASRESLEGFSYAVKRICEGEIEQYESRYSLDVSLLKYLRRIKRKTGVLLALSCVSGIINKKVSKKMLRSIASYGMYFGLAFQITDDILDFIGDEKKVGKPVGNDFIQGIYTLPLIHALKYSDHKEGLVNILNKKHYNKEDVSIVLEIVKSSGGIDFCRKLVDRYIEKGIKSIEFLKDDVYKEVLVELISSLRMREL